MSEENDRLSLQVYRLLMRGYGEREIVCLPYEEKVRLNLMGDDGYATKKQLEEALLGALQMKDSHNVRQKGYRIQQAEEILRTAMEKEDLKNATNVLREINKLEGHTTNGRSVQVNVLNSLNTAAPVSRNVGVSEDADRLLLDECIRNNLPIPKELKYLTLTPEQAQQVIDAQEKKE
jgi:hypothetical protein